MRRVAYVCVALTAVFGGECAYARAEANAETDNSVQLEEGLDLASIADAHAQFATVVPSSTTPSSGAKPFRDVLVYGGIDGWRHGGSGYAGAEWSPLAFETIVVRLFGADGLDDFRAGTTTYRSETARASLLAGIELQSGKLNIKLFAGADFMMRAPLRPAAETPTQAFGARASVDAWWEPADRWMVSGSVSATTIERGLSARLASGFRVPFAWIGPEILATHDIFNTQLRAGAHLSGLKFGGLEWSLAGGYAQDNFKRSGPYARLGVMLRY